MWPSKNNHETLSSRARGLSESREFRSNEVYNYDKHKYSMHMSSKIEVLCSTLPSKDPKKKNKVQVPPLYNLTNALSTAEKTSSSLKEDTSKCKTNNDSTLISYYFKKPSE